VIGKTLDHYKIESKIGEGGMGEVYRATDSRLGRTVAIKILSAGLSDRAEIRERFEREAKAISSLAHPTVCTLYDIGRSGDTEYLVMEFLEGETLGDRLADKGALSTKEALRIGIQIASALDSAHKKGIVHRDLKPGNIMLTDDGVKLLDFGLAKAIDVGMAAQSGMSILATEAAEQPLTQEGTLLGTLQYMSPEQLEGKEVDLRADIFALGLILYEMFGGKKAFEGDSQASLIAAIMSAEPADLTELQPMTPAALDRVVNACLAKKPDQRIQSAHDIQLQLQWILDSKPDSTSQIEVELPELPKKRSGTLLWIAGLVVAVLATFLIASQVGKTGSQSPTTRVSLMAPPTLAPTSEPVEISVSPDGRHVVFRSVDSTGTISLWLRSLDRLEPERIPGTERGSLGFWSPDSRHLGYFMPGKLMRIDLFDTQTPQVICDVTSGRGASWSKNGTIIFAPVSAGPLFSVPAAGGTPQQITFIDTTIAGNAHRYPQFLPDGKQFLFAHLTGSEDAETRLGTLGESETRAILTSQGVARYADPGYLLYEGENSLLAMPFDPDAGKIVGDPVPMLDIPRGTRAFYGSPGVSTSRAGPIVYPQTVMQSQIVWFDRRGTRLGTLPFPPDVYADPVISPDGSRVIITRADQENESDLWMIELNRNTLTRLTFEPRANDSAVWSDDGERLFFASRREGSRNIYVKGNRGTGPTELLLQGASLFTTVQDITPDSKLLLIRELHSDTKDDVLSYDFADGTINPLLNSRFAERDPSISPDGKWIAYRSRETGELELYVQPFPDLGAKYQVSTNGAGNSPTTRAQSILWGPAMDEIVYLAADGLTLMSVPIKTSPAFEAGQPRPIFKLPANHTSYTSIDNRRFLVCLRSDTGAQLTLVTGWQQELEQR
jgi:serine/threonine protein kinase